MSNLAETILRDVPIGGRIYTGGRINTGGNCLDELVLKKDVEAALTAAMDPALTERAGEVLSRLRKADEYEPLGHDGWEAADLITALLAQIAALRAERDASNELGRAFEEDAGQQRERAEAAEAERDALISQHAVMMMERDAARFDVEAAEAQIAALTARVEGLTGALRKAEQNFYEAANRFQDEDYEGPHEKFTVNVVCHIKPYFDMNMKHLRDSAAAARAALSATTEEGK